MDDSGDLRCCPVTVRDEHHTPLVGFVEGRLDVVIVRHDERLVGPGVLCEHVIVVALLQFVVTINMLYRIKRW